MHKSSLRRLAVALLAAALLGACGGSAGDAASGKKLFDGQTPIANGNLPTCISCHADTADGQSPLGPNLSNIGSRAANSAPGQSASEYLRTSILNPDAVLTGGYQEGIMNREYAKGLTSQQVDDLVAYMLTLQTPGPDENSPPPVIVPTQP